MQRHLRRFDAEIYALFRIVAGSLFLCHGAQKLFGLFGGPPGEMPAGLLYTAGAIELVGGALVALGLYARKTKIRPKTKMCPVSNRRLQKYVRAGGRIVQSPTSKHTTPAIPTRNWTSRRTRASLLSLVKGIVSMEA